MTWTGDTFSAFWCQGHPTWDVPGIPGTAGEEPILTRYQDWGVWCGTSGSPSVKGIYIFLDTFRFRHAILKSTYVICLEIHGISFVISGPRLFRITLKVRAARQDLAPSNILVPGPSSRSEALHVQWGKDGRAPCRSRDGTTRNRFLRDGHVQLFGRSTKWSISEDVPAKFVYKWVHENAMVEPCWTCIGKPWGTVYSLAVNGDRSQPAILLVPGQVRLPLGCQEDS